MSSQTIRTAQSAATEARQAVAEFHAAVVQPQMELVIFFCSSEYDLDVLAAEINRLFAGIHVVGCTTAGEIGPSGYLQHTSRGGRGQQRGGRGQFSRGGRGQFSRGGRGQFSRGGRGQFSHCNIARVNAA